MPSIKFIEPWGWSKLDVYRGCPAQFKYKFIDKLKEPSSPALDRGNKIHKQLEQFINGWTTEPPEVHASWLKPLERLRKLQPKTEAAWGIDKDWRALPNWFQSNTWCRAKSDIYYIDKQTDLVLIDFKTGKYRVPSKDQVKLYGAIGYAIMPHVKRVRTSFWFTDQPEPPHEEVYKAEDLINLRGYFTQEASILYKDRSFKPKPGDKCRYCAYSRQKNGPCKY